MGASGAALDSNGLLIVISILAILVITLLILFSIIKKKRVEQISAVNAEFAEKRVLFSDYSANFFGRQSNGMKQIKGNGILLVTDQEVYFSLLMPRREITIPVKEIIAVKSETSFLGKSKFKPLLIVQFNGSDGNLDAVAWLIHDLSACISEIQKLIAVK